MGDGGSDRPGQFLQPLESVLQHRSASFARSAAIAFIDSCWELIAYDSDVWYWSERFVEWAPSRCLLNSYAWAALAIAKGISILG